MAREHYCGRGPRNIEHKTLSHSTLEEHCLSLWVTRSAIDPRRRQEIR